MSTIRLIARLDIKGPNLIKGIHLEGLRIIGNPQEYAVQYYHDGADELIYIDAVASLYNRNSLLEIVSSTAQNVFIPFTVGGGIRTVDDVDALLRAGADKIAVNTAAVQTPELITNIARRFGAQCIVAQIDAKSLPNTHAWEVYTNGGRERTGKDVVEWAKQVAELGAGEILLTSIDREGTRKGMDLDLLTAVVQAVSIPVIASGGIGNTEHLYEAARTNISAIAMADILHYRRCSLTSLRSYAEKVQIPVRKTYNV